MYLPSISFVGLKSGKPTRFRIKPNDTPAHVKTLGDSNADFNMNWDKAMMAVAAFATGTSSGFIHDLLSEQQVRIPKLRYDLGSRVDDELDPNNKTWLELVSLNVPECKADRDHDEEETPFDGSLMTQIMRCLANGPHSEDCEGMYQVAYENIDCEFPFFADYIDFVKRNGGDAGLFDERWLEGHISVFASSKRDSE